MRGASLTPVESRRAAEDTVLPVAVRAKEFRYAVELAGDGAVTAEGEARLVPPELWTPDHLLLAALVRCSVESLRHHATRTGIEVEARGSARGVVTKPAPTERYRFVELDAELDVTLQPEPAPHELAELLARAERDCFVGSSLTAPPRYRWRVNGSEP